MTFPRIGRKVRFHPLQRVDLPDIDAMGDLPGEAVSSALAGLVGDIEPEATGGSASRRYTAQNGLLSALAYQATGQVVTFGPMRFGWLVDTTPAHATIEDYDPNDPGSTASLNFGLHEGQTPFVWARRLTSDTDTASRRFWDDATTVEVTRAETTRTKVSIQLGLSLPGNVDNPPKGTGWVRIARALTVPESGDVVLEPRHAFDRYDAHAEADTAIGKRAKYYADGRETFGAGFNDAFSAIFATLSKLRDGRWQFDPDTFKTDGAMPVDLQGWRDLLDDPDAIGLAQLEDNAGLADNISRFFAGYTAGRDGVLATIVCRTDVVATGTFENYSPFFNIATAAYTNGPTSHGGDGHWWRVDLGSLVAPYPPSYPGESVDDPLQPNIFGNCLVTGISVAPLHYYVNAWDDEETWASDARAVVPEVVPSMQLPSGAGAGFKVKVRFRSNETNHPVKRPVWGWTMLIWGRPII